MRSLRAALAASLAALALLAGCSDDDSSPGDPTSTWTPTGKPETPTSSAATPTEPVLPDAATKATEDGARAFIAYYWELINYAQLTGDVKALKRVSGPKCDACAGINDRLHDQYRQGGRVEGGTNSIRIMKASELTTASKSAYGFRVRVEVSHDAQTVYDSDGTPDMREAGTDVVTMVLFWADGERWRLDILQVD